MSTIISLIVLFFIFSWFLKSEHKLKIVAGVVISFILLMLISSGYGMALLYGAIFLGSLALWFWYDSNKYNKNGYDKEGFNRQGLNALGYDKNGFNKDGFDKYGLDKYGLDNLGYDKDGFDKYGFDSQGYNKFGLDAQGRNRQGYKDGVDVQGRDVNGFDQNGINQYGFDRNGYNTQVFPFFQRHVKLLDTNILMADKNYDGLFNFFINYGVHITILESVFDELINIKDSRTHSQDAIRSAFVGLNRVSQLQDSNLLTLVDIGIQTKGRAYADPIIIEYLKSITNQSVALITNDLDVKIRANHFKGSVDTQAVLGKDLIRELYGR